MDPKVHTKDKKKLMSQFRERCVTLFQNFAAKSILFFQTHIEKEYNFPEISGGFSPERLP